MMAIWNQWIPGSGHKPIAVPSFERYGAEFNPQTGLRAIEIWIPIES